MEQHASPTKSSYVPTINGWRGLGILWVCLCHAEIPLIEAGLLVKGSIANQVILQAELALEVFFIMSGYLITQRLILERERKGRISLRKFYVRRFFRLYPSVLAYVGFIAILIAAGLVTTRWGDLAATAFMYRNYWPSRDWLTGHFWTLSIEEHFYLLWPVALIFIWKLQRPLVGLLAILAIALAWRFAFYNGELADISIPGVKNAYRTDFRIVIILIGCLMGFVFYHPHRREDWARRFSLPLALFCAAMLTVSIALEWEYKVIWRSLFLPPILLYPLLNQRTLFARFLEWKPVVTVGLMSYTIYIWQQFFMQPNARNVLPLPVDLQSWPWNFLGLAVVTILAHRFIEEKFRQINPVLPWQKTRPDKAP